MQYQSSAKKELTINNRKFEYFDLNSIDNELVRTLPYSLKILLENLLRHEDGINDWDTAFELAFNIYLDIINLLLELLEAMGNS